MFNVIINVTEELRVQKIATLSGVIMTTTVALLKGLGDRYGCRKNRLGSWVWMITLGSVGEHQAAPVQAVQQGLDPPWCWWGRTRPRAPSKRVKAMGHPRMALLEGHGEKELLPSPLKPKGLGRGSVPSWGLVGRRASRSKPGCRIWQLCLFEQVFTECLQTLIGSQFGQFSFAPK